MNVWLGQGAELVFWVFFGLVSIGFWAWSHTAFLCDTGCRLGILEESEASWHLWLFGNHFCPLISAFIFLGLTDQPLAVSFIKAFWGGMSTYGLCLELFSFPALEKRRFTWGAVSDNPFYGIHVMDRVLS